MNAFESCCLYRLKIRPKAIFAHIAAHELKPRLRTAYISLAHRPRQKWFDLIKPYPVAFRRRVKQIRKHLARKRSVRLEELCVEIEPHDLFSVGKLLNLGIYVVIAFSLFVLRRRLTRENRREQNPCLWLLAAYRLHNSLYAIHHGVRTFRIVRANHQHDILRLIAIHLAVRNSPKHVLCAVAAVSEIENPVFRRHCVPRVGGRTRPVLEPSLSVVVERIDELRFIGIQPPFPVVRD